MRGGHVHHRRQGLRRTPVSHLHDIRTDAEGNLKRQEGAQQQRRPQQSGRLRELDQDSSDKVGHEHGDHARACDVQIEALSGVAVHSPYD